jgi:hypothetical protein
MARILPVKILAVLVLALISTTLNMYAQLARCAFCEKVARDYAKPRGISGMGWPGTYFSLGGQGICLILVYDGSFLLHQTIKASNKELGGLRVF